MLTFALSRDSRRDLHIYKDLYGENSDCMCNLSQFTAIVSFRRTGLLPLCILPKVGYLDKAVDPICQTKTALNSLQQLQSPPNSKRLCSNSVLSKRSKLA